MTTSERKRMSMSERIQLRAPRVLLDASRRSAEPQLTSLQAPEDVGVEMAPEPMAEAPLEKVLPVGCASCEEAWLKTSRETEASEHERLALLQQTNLSEFLQVGLRRGAA